MAEIEYYIGILSGTSMDGVSAVLVEFGDAQPKCVANHSVDYPEELRTELQALSEGCDNEIDRMGLADRHAGAVFAETVNQLLSEAGVSASQVRAIGSHGQTIRHRPISAGLIKRNFSVQIGDPNTIAEQTGIAVVADLRRRDIACGGEGAPLAPAFHAYAFGEEGHRRLVVNIGGIANLSVLDGKSIVAGFDCGCGNLLMDQWCLRHKGEPYDKDGDWAASGNSDEVFLAILNNHPFLRKSIYTAPYSTGREEFNIGWLEQCLVQYATEISEVDVQATLCEWTAKRITKVSEGFVGKDGLVTDGLYVCGGGAYNKHLMEQLRHLCKPLGLQLNDTSELGISPHEVEGVVFAWLAKCHIEGVASNAPAVSGAGKPCVLGCLYPANSAS